MKNFTRFTLALSAILIISFGCNNDSNKSQTESSTTETNNTSAMVANGLNQFGKRYAEAWCSQHPDSVSAFFADSGSLKVNNNEPAVGRAAIAKVAEGFMTAFPDMIVSMDSMKATPAGTEFHWTLSGTNTGPNGTGKKVRVSGFEVWRFDEHGLILQSLGTFDSDEYNRQLKYGVE